jgi:hypothetical protein
VDYLSLKAGKKPLVKGSGSFTKTEKPKVDTVPVAAAPEDDFDSDLPF